MLKKVAEEDQDDAMLDIYAIIYIILLLYALWTHEAPECQPDLLEPITYKRQWQIALHGCK